MMDVIFNIGAVLFVFIALGFCIFSHELGHFLAAKMCKLHIDAFSLGFRPVWRKKINGVEYRLGWLPFGGYVELPQIDAADGIPKAADGTELRRATAWERIVTAAAGPFFNIVSGLLIGCFVWLIGMPQDTPKMREIPVRALAKKSPEYRAGLRNGDVIVRLNGEKFFLTWAKFVETLLYTVGPVELEVLRDGKTLTIRYVPEENPNAPGSLRSEKMAYPFFHPVVPLELFPEKGSVAEKAGLRRGDVLTGVAGNPVTDYLQLQWALNFHAGRPLVLEVRRGQQELTVTVTPQEIPGMEAETRYLAGITMEAAAPGKVRVAGVMAGGAAAAAGIKAGDLLLELDGKPLTAPEAMQQAVAALKERPFSLKVEREGALLEFQLAARRFVPATIGVSMAVYDHPTPWQQLCNTVEMSWKSLRGIATGIGNKLGWTENQSTLKPSHMSGPLGIGMVLFTSVRTSPILGIYFVVVISFALAIFNLLPFPVLDGGHIFFGLIEVICRRPVPTVIVRYLSYVFVALLISLMVYVTFSDGRRLVRKIQREIPREVNHAPQNP